VGRAVELIREIGLRAVDAAVAEDRAAVVAWLRANTCGCYDFASAIERGEHRREEEK
jgi:hypothetical protein